MKLSTQTIVVLGIIQCIILTLILVLFLRYQRSLEPSASSEAGLEAGK
ncbi:MAG: hypothetical protein WAT81_05345 [Candidatus Moraniibacteriota bacterium]